MILVFQKEKIMLKTNPEVMRSSITESDYLENKLFFLDSQENL